MLQFGGPARFAALQNSAGGPNWQLKQELIRQLRTELPKRTLSFAAPATVRPRAM